MKNTIKLAHDDFWVLSPLLDRLAQQIKSESHLGNDVHHTHCHTLIVKFFRHAISIKRIAEGTVLSEMGGTATDHIDLSSVMVLARSALETFLVWHFLVLCPDPTIRSFRYAAWRLGGLCERQKIITYDDYYKKRQASDIDEINRLKAELSNHPAISLMKPGEKNRFLAGEWKWSIPSSKDGLPGYRDLIQLTDLPQLESLNMYGFLCGHSHASFISSLQIGQAISLNTQREISDGILIFVLRVMAFFCQNIASLLPDGLSPIEQNPDIKSTLSRWMVK